MRLVWNALTYYFANNITSMIGIGAKQDKYTKIKIMAERAKEYNQKYDSLISQGLDPQQTASRLQKEEYQKRHGQLLVEEPYKVSTQINQIGGAVHLGYHKAHNIPTSTQTQYAPMASVMQAKRTGTSTNFKTTKTPQDIDQLNKMKAYIQKDHLAQNFAIDLGEKKTTDYKQHFNDDDKMKEIRATKDKQYNQRKNELNWYVEEYIKTKESLRNVRKS